MWRAKQAAALDTATDYDWLALAQHWQLEAGALKVHIYIVMCPAEKLYIKQKKNI